MVTRTGIGGALLSRDTVREGGIERDGKEREERIEEIEDTESDTEVVTELRGKIRLKKNSMSLQANSEETMDMPEPT